MPSAKAELGCDSLNGEGTWLPSAFFIVETGRILFSGYPQHHLGSAIQMDIAAE